MIEKLLIALLEGFENTGLNTSRIVISLALAFALGIYIHFIYRVHAQHNLYSKNFNATLAVIAPIMAAMVLTMQSSLIISLSSIGALSIIRFRTPIKDPMDLLYLFWSIGCGIMCGAGVYEVVLWATLIVTLGILVINMFPHRKNSYILVVNGTDTYPEEEVEAILKSTTKNYKIRSQSFSKDQYDLVFDIRTHKTNELLRQIRSLSFIQNVSLITQDGEIDG